MPNIKWTPADVFFLKTNAGTKTDKELIDEFLKRGKVFTLKAIRLKRLKEGIIKKPGRGVCELEQEKNNIGKSGEN